MYLTTKLDYTQNVQKKAIILIGLHSLSLNCLHPRKHQFDLPLRNFFNSGPVRGPLPFSSDGAGDIDGDEGAGGSSTMVIPRVVAPDRILESNLVRASRMDNGDRVSKGKRLAGDPKRVEEPLDSEVPCNLAIQRCSSSRSLTANLDASSQRNFSLFMKA